LYQLAEGGSTVGAPPAGGCCRQERPDHCPACCCCARCFSPTPYSFLRPPSFLPTIHLGPGPRSRPPYIPPPLAGRRICNHSSRRGTRGCPAQEHPRWLCRRSLSPATRRRQTALVSSPGHRSSPRRDAPPRGPRCSPPPRPAPLGLAPPPHPGPVTNAARHPRRHRALQPAVLPVSPLTPHSADGRDQTRRPPSCTSGT